MSPLSRARKRDFADVALRRREAEGILADREERNGGIENEERRKEETGEGEGSRGTRAARDGGAERVS